MALEPVKVPQNVYVEDRIMGPITLRHLVILGIGAGISYAIWAIVSSAGPVNIVIQVVCWIPLAIAAAFAFVKINDISLFKMILLMIEQSNKPNVRYWAPHTGISINIITKQTAKEETADIKQTAKTSKLLEMASSLEAEQREIAAHDEAEFMEKQLSTETSEQHALPVDKSRVSASVRPAGSTMDGISPHS